MTTHKLRAKLKVQRMKTSLNALWALIMPLPIRPLPRLPARSQHVLEALHSERRQLSHCLSESQRVLTSQQWLICDDYDNVYAVGDKEYQLHS